MVACTKIDVRRYINKAHVHVGLLHFAQVIDSPAQCGGTLRIEPCYLLVRPPCFLAIDSDDCVAFSLRQENLGIAKDTNLRLSCPCTNEFVEFEELLCDSCPIGRDILWVRLAIVERVV